MSVVRGVTGWAIEDRSRRGVATRRVASTGDRPDVGAAPWEFACDPRSGDVTPRAAAVGAPSDDVVVARADAPLVAAERPTTSPASGDGVRRMTSSNVPVPSGTTDDERRTADEGAAADAVVERVAATSAGVTVEGRRSDGAPEARVGGRCWREKARGNVTRRSTAAPVDAGAATSVPLDCSERPGAVEGSVG